LHEVVSNHVTLPSPPLSVTCVPMCRRASPAMVQPCPKGDACSFTFSTCTGSVVVSLCVPHQLVTSAVYVYRPVSTWGEKKNWAPSRFTPPWVAKWVSVISGVPFQYSSRSVIRSAGCWELSVASIST
jgi:hypothetical protein